MTAMKPSASTAWKIQVARWIPRSAPCVNPSATKPRPSAQPTGDHGAHQGSTTASRQASMTKPVTLMTNRSASTHAKREVASTRAGRWTNRRQTAIPRPMTKKSPNMSSTVS